MAKKHYHGSCHCNAVRYEVDLDLAKGTQRCNCTLCWKARNWFAFVGANDLQLLTDANDMSEYRWTPKGKPEPFLTHRFCKHCGTRIYATGELDAMGGRFYALNIPTLDDVDIGELRNAPLTYNDNFHDAPGNTPANTGLL